MAQPTHQTSFASGEWAPKLRGRVDIQKYRSGAALLRNFYVDYAGGGASTRPGTAFVGVCGGSAPRLIPFQPSTSVSYVLEFGDHYIRFFSNGTQITSGGPPYQISSPYAAADLFPNPSTGNPGIKYVQDINSLIICHPSYQPQILTINTPTNWTLSTINFGSAISAPGSLIGSTTLGAGAWNYAYAVTAVDRFGHESTFTSVVVVPNVLPLESTQGSITITWLGVSGAASYNVYKILGKYNIAATGDEQFGFVANVLTTAFTDSTPGIAPDFSQPAPIGNNPFSGLSVTGATVTTPGTYTAVPGVTFAAPPSGDRAYGYVSIGVTALSFGGALVLHNTNGNPASFGTKMYFGDDEVITVTAATSLGGNNYQVTAATITNPGSITGFGTAAPATDTTNDFSDGTTYVSGNLGLTWGVNAVRVYDGGTGYSSAPAITFSSGAATATAILSAGGNPGVPQFYQERLVLAAQQQAPQTVNFSVPGDFFNFNVSFPAQDSDSITAQIIGEQLNDIRSLLPVSSGLIALTGQGAWQLNGGGGVSAATPITPANISAQTQAFNGANDLRPIKINLDILYATNKGNYVRDFSYNIYANVYTGADISSISNHLFFGFGLIDWTWSEEPFKNIWVVRDDGILLSLAYVKEQELVAWAHHDTNGQFTSVTSVIELTPNGTVDAVYVVVKRFINGAYVYYVERFADRFFPYGCEDSWAVDCGLQTQPQATVSSTLFFTGDSSAVGNSVTLSDTVGTPFTAPMAAGNWVVRSNGGIYKITAFTSASQVTAQVLRVPTVIDPYTNTQYPDIDNYTIWQPVTSVSGLTQLVGQQVVGVIDGVAVGPLTVSGGGSVTLPFAGTKITLGLKFTPQLQTLPLDLGEPTVQSKRKKLPAVTLRVADTLGLQVGTSFSNLVTMKDFQLGAIPSQSNGPVAVTDLVNQFASPTLIDGYQKLDQVWQEVGQLCVQQNLPYPATIIAVIPEVTVGDSK